MWSGQSPGSVLDTCRPVMRRKSAGEVKLRAWIDAQVAKAADSTNARVFLTRGVYRGAPP